LKVVEYLIDITNIWWLTFLLYITSLKHFRTSPENYKKRRSGARLCLSLSKNVLFSTPLSQACFYGRLLLRSADSRRPLVPTPYCRPTKTEFPLPDVCTLGNSTCSIDAERSCRRPSTFLTGGWSEENNRLYALVAKGVGTAAFAPTMLKPRGQKCLFG